MKVAHRDDDEPVLIYHCDKKKLPQCTVHDDEEITSSRPLFRE